MGVRGLTKFINNNDRRYLERYKLHNTFVIIDGNSLACTLFCLHGIREYIAFGGDYDRYAQHVKDFFQMLSQCNIKPVVVFDGGYEKKKLKTAINRLKEKTALLKRMMPASDSAPIVFPLLMLQVFKEVLLEIGVPIVQCDFEADQEIAALGRKYNCPILSNDSDFFISGVQYIPIPTIEHEARPLNFSWRPTNQFCIHCKIFRLENFLDSFGGLDKSMLPLLSALSGNDYVEINLFRKFYLQLQIGEPCPADVRVAGVIEWLTSVASFDSALQGILRTVERNSQRFVLRKIEETIKSYCCNILTVESYLPLEFIRTYSSSNPKPLMVNLNQMIDSIENISSILEENSDDYIDQKYQWKDYENESMEYVDENLQRTSQVKSDLNKLPNWLLNNCRKGLVNSKLIDILTLKTCLSIPQVEDKDLNPCHEVSHPLLRAMIKMIHGDIKISVSYWARNKDSLIEIYNLKPLDTDLPNLQNVLELSPESRRNILLNLLSVPADFCMTIFPDEWKLYLCTIFYWIKNANTTSHMITEVHVKSLILCLIALNIIDKGLGFIREISQFLTRYGSKLSRHTISPTKPYREFRDLLLEVDVNDCIICFDSLFKFHRLNEDLESDISLFSYPGVHAFAQFQNCLQHAMILNSLLIFPLKQCMVHKLFSGTFIYNVCSTLNDHKNFDNVLRNLLGKSPKLFEVFTTLVSVILPALSSSAAPSRKSRRRRRKRKTENLKGDIKLVEETRSAVISTALP